MEKDGEKWNVTCLDEKGEIIGKYVKGEERKWIHQFKNSQSTSKIVPAWLASVSASKI